MPVPRHLEEAAARLEAAERKLRATRSEDYNPLTLARWLDALTEHALALSDIQRYTNESVHEKLHALASGKLPLRPIPGPAPK